MDKIWKINDYNDEFDKKYLINSLLEKRNLITQKEKNIFLTSKLKYLSDPFEFPEMKKAVKRIKKAVDNKEKILIYGDYDVDGITSTALLYLFFKDEFDFKVDYYLPDRIKDGYGLNLKVLKNITDDIDLIITVDCGITAFKEAEFLKNQDVDLIITDHHTPADKLPAAEAVINHHLINENHFAADIAGVGTAFKLAQALNGGEINSNLTELLPITALGTVADIAPLKTENRILVKNGLKKFEADNNLGLKKLIEELKLNKKDISAGQIGFIIAPPLNAAGRINNAQKALRLLITENEKEAEKIARELVKLNKERQKKEEIIYNQAEKKIENLNLKEEKSIILADSNWHSGIIGIVASRLLEKYNLPVILFALDNDEKIAKGSARSISNLNIYQALKYCSSKILNFGGHKAAAGLSVEVKNIDEFKKTFKKYLFSELKEEDYIKVNNIDMNLKLSDLSKSLINKLENLKPFGIANPSPRFLFKNIKVNNCFQMGKENKHLKFYLKKDLQAVAFNMGDLADKITFKVVDLIAQPEINSWRGRENLQLKVNDIRLTGDINIPLLYQNEKIKFYDLRTENKEITLKKLLNNKVIEKAAVYINQKSKRNFFKGKYNQHTFFANEIKKDLRLTHLIFYSLPFSIKQFNNIINQLKSLSNFSHINIILMFSESDIRFNQEIIKRKFAGILEVDFSSISKNELDFKDSIRYNKLSRQMEKFMNFKELSFKNNLFDLLADVSNFKEDKNES